MYPLGFILIVGVAGALGAVARYGVGEWTARWWWRRFPLATLMINVSGAFALGLLLAAGGTHGGSSVTHWRTILGTGFLGGYTTFSTLSYETQGLARRGYLHHAWLNVAGTLCAGITAAALGIAIGRMI